MLRFSGFVKNVTKGGQSGSIMCDELFLRFGKPISGRLTVDAGARKALVEGGASLLAVGVTAVDGRFEAGDAVELAGPDGVPFAKGIAGADAREIAGRQRGVEAVHRDRLVLLA